MISQINRMIITIIKQIPFDKCIRIHKSIQCRIIVSTSKVVQSSFHIIDIPSIPKRLDSAQCRSERTGGGEDLTPRIIGIFNYLCPRAIHQRDHVALEVVQVCVGRAVKNHDAGLALCVVIEMQRMIALGHVHDILAVQRVFRCTGAGCGFPGPQAVLIVLEGDRLRAVDPGHLLQLPPVLPGIGPGAVVQRVAHGVVGDGRAVKRRQLILPSCVAVGVRVAFRGRAHRAGGIRISRLGQDVAAQVVGIHPGGAPRARGHVRLVVHADQLPDSVVHIAGGLGAVADAYDVAVVVVGIGQRHAALGDGLDQAGGALRAVAAGHVGISRLDRGGCGLHRALGDAPQTVVGVRRAARAVGQGRQAVLVIVAKAGGVPGPRRAHVFREGVGQVVSVVGQFAGVGVRRARQVGLAAGPARQVVIRVHGHAPGMIGHVGRAPLGVVAVGEAVLVGPVVTDAGHPAEAVVQVFHLAAVAEHDPVHRAPNGIIVRGAEHVAAHAHAGLPAQAVVAEMVDHAVGGIAVGIVGSAGEIPRLAVVGVLRLHLLVIQHRGRLGQPAQGVVLAVHLLSERVGRLGYGAAVRIGHGGGRLAPGVGLADRIGARGGVSGG